MLDVGMPVDSVGWNGITALKSAARMNRTGVIRLLLNRGADVDKQSGNYNSTALHTAAFNNSTGVIEVLLKHGASTNIKDSDGITPVDLARQRNNEAAVSLLERY